MKKVYLDYASTTPIERSVADEMMPFLRGSFGNPSSLHVFGQEALFALDKARKKVAEFLGARESEIIFTSSATEANNIALLGSLQEKDHVITSSIEHKAVLEPLNSSGAKVTHLSLDREGIVKVEDVLSAIRDDTALVSLMYANSEIGTVQPIKEVGAALKKINKNRKKKIIFHTDAVQAVNYLSCRVNDLNVDLLTISGHKIYGPKGVGALYKREGVKVSPIFYGAKQEKGIRPGTENIAAIVGLKKALEELDKNNKEETRKLRDRIIDTVLSEIPQTKLNGSKEKRLPNNVNISFKGVEGESLLIALDQKGIAVSTGSACASRSLLPSYVLLATGLSHEEAHGSLRITLGRMTTEKEVDYFLEQLPSIVEKLRKISGK